MKKLLTLVLALCLMMTVALAEETPSLTWSDFEPVLEAAGVTGQFYNFDDVAVKIWLPDGINPVELTEEDTEKGYIGYFADEEQSCAVAVMYVDVNGMTLEEYGEYLGGLDDVTEVEMATVNGLPCVTYTMPGQDCVCISFTTEAGYVLEVTCSPQSVENADLVWGAVAASIQPE